VDFTPLIFTVETESSFFLTRAMYVGYLFKQRKIISPEGSIITLHNDDVSARHIQPSYTRIQLLIWAVEDMILSSTLEASD